MQTPATLRYRYPTGIVAHCKPGDMPVHTYSVQQRFFCNAVGGIERWVYYLHNSSSSEEKRTDTYTSSCKQRVRVDRLLSKHNN